MTILTKEEKVAYHRGIWVGWKRGLDSHIRWGPILQEFILTIVERGCDYSKMPQKWRVGLRRAISDLEEIEVHSMLNDEDTTGVYDMPWNPLKKDGEDDDTDED